MIDINKILGKKKGTKTGMPTMNFSGLVKKTTGGASLQMQNRWKQMSPVQKRVARARYPDTDRDRIPNRFDCQPRNSMRQDSGYKRGDVNYNDTVINSTGIPYSTAKYYIKRSYSELLKTFKKSNGVPITNFIEAVNSRYLTEEEYIEDNGSYNLTDAQKIDLHKLNHTLSKNLISTVQNLRAEGKI